ncbi:hypothetical protein CLAIMM_10658 [Cladophialophora immunda]|nr:hypothetical protein CLAIMM_10658 [Cladophialophora immunda]
MSTFDDTCTTSPLPSASRSLSLSSTTTIHDEDLRHRDMAQMIKDDNTSKNSHDIDAKDNAPLGRKSKTNTRHGVVELGYQKVLRSMITEPREPFRYLDRSTSTVRQVQCATDIELRLWKRALHSLRIRKFSQVSKAALPVFNVMDEGVPRALEILMAKFGRATHSSFFDDIYSIYLPEGEQAAVCFKVIKKVAVMYGDPLCAADEVDHVFEAFCSFCHRRRWHIAVVGAGFALALYAKNKHWRTMEFAVEQILNPMTNSVLDERSGNTITRTNKRLVANGIQLYLYEPCRGIQFKLEEELIKVYSGWQQDRRKRNAPQAYSASINPFALPAVNRYMYTTDSNDKPNSLAGLIRLGANGGYLLEPSIQLPDAPKGVIGFLVTHAMGLLRDEGVAYMTFGLELCRN